MMENGKINYMDRTSKNIVDVLTVACHVPIRDVCVLHHDDEHFKAYVHGTSWYCDNVHKVIMKAWNVKEENISAKISPECWWPLGSRGYIIEVKYE